MKISDIEKPVLTIGYKDSYDADMAELGSAFVKLGRQMLDGKPYLGGIVFSSVDDAVDYMRANGLVGYGVYKLAADWDRDTYEVGGERRLLNKCRILSITE